MNGFADKRSTFIDDAEVKPDQCMYELKLKDPQAESVSSIDDLEALKTDWEALNEEGSSFRTHRLAISNTQARVKKTVWMILFANIWFLIGVLGGLVWGLGLLADQVWIQIGSILMAITWFVMWNKPVYQFLNNNSYVFDKDKDAFSLNKLRDKRITGIMSGALSEIHALQLIEKQHRTGGKHRTTYRSYELNAVVKYGLRFNIIDHGNENTILEDAKKLSDFLGGVPIWSGFLPGRIEKSTSLSGAEGIDHLQKETISIFTILLRLFSRN